MEKLINQGDRFFVAGHRGMAGSAICRALQRSGYENLLTASRDELDLLDLQAVSIGLLNTNQLLWCWLLPRWVAFMRMTRISRFFAGNPKIQTNVIETVWRSGVRRLLFWQQLYLSKVR